MNNTEAVRVELEVLYEDLPVEIEPEPVAMVIKSFLDIVAAAYVPM